MWTGTRTAGASPFSCRLFVARQGGEPAGRDRWDAGVRDAGAVHEPRPRDRLRAGIFHFRQGASPKATGCSRGQPSCSDPRDRGGRGIQGLPGPAQCSGLKIPTSLMHQELETLPGLSVSRKIEFEGSFDLSSLRGKEGVGRGIAVAGLRIRTRLCPPPDRPGRRPVRRTGAAAVRAEQFTAKMAGAVEAAGFAAVRRGD